MQESTKRKVLIVDDEEMNLKVLSIMLDNYGYAFDTAVNGKAAIEKAPICKPDLIFLDIMMPEMDGFEVCRTLKADPGLKHIPVVMITALADKESRIRGLQCGANDFLAKPVDPTEVKVKTANLLKIKEYEDALKRQNELLEETVRNRTEDLTKVVADLKSEMEERRVVEAELLQKHEKLQALFNQVALIKKEWERSMDCTGDMILMIDDAGRIKRCNRTMKDFTGLQYSDILQRDWRELLNSYGLSSDRSSEGMPEQSTELYHEQSQRWFSLNNYTYGDKALEFAGTVLTLHDITERKNMTDALAITNEEVETNRVKLETALGEIEYLIQQVTFKKDFSVRFANPNLRHCREVMNCTKTECPCYYSDNQRCWQTANTFCGNSTQGTFADKFDNCSECSTYKFATMDPIYQIGESFNNMMYILSQQHGELEQTYNNLKLVQLQITQQEKMASIGQLAAGVAHEINNPTGFIMSNLGSLQKYADKLTDFVKIQTEALAKLPAESAEEIAKQRKALKVDFIIEDISSLVKESLDGADRIKKIVQDLKTFSRVDEAELKMADINTGIESTINIVWNELKYKATVNKEYGDIPQLKCNPGQLNQVFMNMLVNAAHAIEKQGEIGIRTWADNGMINVSVSDTGSGIPKDKLNRIFEPFFTTKEVGRGTGLGLSIAYDIVKKHKGMIEVESEVGK